MNKFNDARTNYRQWIIISNLGLSKEELGTVLGNMVREYYG